MKFTMFSDSQSALQAGSHYASLHHTVQKVQDWVVRIHSKHKCVKFFRCPGHVGIISNGKSGW